MQGVAEGNQPLSARGNDVLGMPGRVTTGDPDPYAGKDLLRVRDRTHARCRRVQLVALRPFRRGHQVVGVDKGRPAAAGHRMPGPAEVIGVQVGEGHRFDLFRPAAELGQAVQKRTAVHGAVQSSRLGR